MENYKIYKQQVNLTICFNDEKLKEEEKNIILKNGSFMGFLAETGFRTLFPNIIKADKNGINILSKKLQKPVENVKEIIGTNIKSGKLNSLDHFGLDGTIYEQKHSSDGITFNILPSSMKGMGRKFDEILFLEYLKRKYFILSRFKNNNFEYIKIPGNEIREFCSGKNKYNIKTIETKKLFKE